MSGERILVIEDDAVLRDAVDIILGQEGFLVSSAPNGEDALPLIRRLKPHLVLLDVRLPGMSGIDTLRLIRRQGHRMPILMMTADSSPATVRDVLADGGNGYVLKPFDPKQLSQRVRKGLAGPDGEVVVLDS